MSKRILLVLVVTAALAIVGVLALLFQDVEPMVSAASTAESARARTEAARPRDADAAPSTNDVGRAESADQAPTKEADAAPVATLSPDESVEVLVVEKKSGAPVDGAEIWFATRDFDDAEQVESFWSWLRDCQLEEKLEPIAQRFVADAEGKARVPIPGRSSFIVAKRGELWGYTYASKTSEPPLKIELIADANVNVHVVDERGSPVANALVALRSRNGKWFNDRVATSTDVEGTAVLRHVGHAVGQQQVGFRQNWCIALGAALEQPVEFAFEAGQVPETVKLVMPATGECEVRVLDPSGQPHAASVEVALSVLSREANLIEVGEDDYSHDAELHDVRGGSALFRHVELGRSFEAAVGRRGSNVQHRARDVGPTAAGQRAIITVRLGERTAVLTGRVLDGDGAVLAKTKLRASIGHAQTNDLEYTWSLTSDADGRFELDASVEREGEPPRTLTLYTVDDRDQERSAARRDLPTGLGPGVHELGDFTLLTSPVLLAGNVVDDEGRPIRGASITPTVKQFWDESDPNGFWWQDLWSNRGTSDQDGHFEIRGRVEATELGVRASTRELKGELVMVAPGATNVTLRLSVTGEIAGVVLLDDSVPRDALSMRVEPSGEGRDPDAQWTAPVPIAEDGKFSFKALKPGSYTVHVNNATVWDSLREVSDVRVVGGEVTRDPRLDPLDLRGTLHAFKLDIVDADDHPIEQGFVLTHEPSASEQPERYSYFQNGKAILFHSGQGLDVTVSSEGYRGVSLQGISTDQKVVLRRGVAVRFHLARGLSAPLPPLYLGVRLELVDGGSGAHGWFGGEDSFFDGRGELAMNSPVVGRAKLVVTITMRDDRMWTSTDYTDDAERVIEIADRAGEQNFDVSLDAAKLDEQIRALRDSSDQ